MKSRCFLMMSLLVTSALLLPQAKQEFSLTVKDLQDSLTDNRALENITQLDSFAQISNEQTKDFFKNSLQANTFIEKLKSITKDQKKQLSRKELPSQLRQTYLAHHVSFSLAEKAMQKNMNEKKVAKKCDIFSSLFFTIGSYVTAQKLNTSENIVKNFNNYVKQEKYDESDENAQELVDSYVHNLNGKMNTYFHANYNANKYIRVMRSTLALQYQHLFDAYSENQKNYRKKIIKSLQLLMEKELP